MREVKVVPRPGIKGDRVREGSLEDNTEGREGSL